MGRRISLVQSEDCAASPIREALSNDARQCHLRSSQHAPEDRQMVGAPPARTIVDAGTCLVTQSGLGLLLHLVGSVADRRIVHVSRTTQAALSSSILMPRQSLQRCGTFGLDEIQSPTVRVEGPRLMIAGY